MDCHVCIILWTIIHGHPCLMLKTIFVLYYSLLQHVYLLYCTWLAMYIYFRIHGQPCFFYMFYVTHVYLDNCCMRTKNESRFFKKCYVQRTHLLCVVPFPGLSFFFLMHASVVGILLSHIIFIELIGEIAFQYSCDYTSYENTFSPFP